MPGSVWETTASCSLFLKKNTAIRIYTSAKTTMENPLPAWTTIAASFSSSCRGRSAKRLKSNIGYLTEADG